MEPNLQYEMFPLESPRIPPYHYRKGGMELWDIIREFLTHEEFVGHLKGNILKYTYRYKSKGHEEDLKKATDYIHKLREVEYGAVRNSNKS